MYIIFTPGRPIANACYSVRIDFGRRVGVRSFAPRHYVATLRGRDPRSYQSQPRAKFSSIEKKPGSLIRDMHISGC